MSKNLTEKWKNKELPHGAFYVKVFTGVILIDFFDATRLEFIRCEDDIEEVIDIVPCYTNFQEYNSKIHILTESQMKLENTIGELAEENARQKELIKRLGSDIEGLDIKKMLLIVEVNNLKGLLKECQTILQETKKDRGIYFNNLHLTDTLTEIEEVLK